MELDELARRLDRLEKAHAATRMVLGKLMLQLSVNGAVEDEELEAFVRAISGHMLSASDEDVATMREQVARLVAIGTGGESDWRHVLGRAMDGGDEDEDPIAALLPAHLR